MLLCSDENNCVTSTPQDSDADAIPSAIPPLAMQDMFIIKALQPSMRIFI